MGTGRGTQGGVRISCGFHASGILETFKESKGLIDEMEGVEPECPLLVGRGAPVKSLEFLGSCDRGGAQWCSDCDYHSINTKESQPHHRDTQYPTKPTF